MVQVYSTYEAKAKFSEILRKVKAGQRVIISYRGEQVAEIRPIEAPPPSLEVSLKQLQADGIIAPPKRRKGNLKPIVRHTGALARFLESRE
jgi:prevent-host-death family protein